MVRKSPESGVDGKSDFQSAGYSRRSQLVWIWKLCAYVSFQGSACGFICVWVRVRVGGGGMRFIDLNYSSSGMRCWLRSLGHAHDTQQIESLNALESPTLIHIHNTNQDDSHIF